ncbi:MAG: hypothetical protein QXU96_02145 [Ignisphaera sp.]
MGRGIQCRDVGFPHSCEPEPYEGGAVGRGFPKGVEADDMGSNEGCPEDCEAKS